MKKIARRSPDWLRDAVVYQIFLRPFTPAGTIRAAAELLPHLAGLGVDLIYLCPIAMQDQDLRTEFWSDRQNRSGLGNPANPYRISDYFAVDPEYGSDDDLKRLVGQAHELGMRIVLDLVYYHCGPTAGFIAGHPDYVKCDAEGNVVNGHWHFPEINFESAGLREYLWRNMEYFIRDFDVDGYRCDVGASIPLDFWEEGRRRIEALKPDCVMICEGDRADDQLAAFDLNYGFAWEYALIGLFKQEKTAAELRRTWEKMHDEFPENARFLRILDNHDIAHDCGPKRHEATFGPRGVEAALLINFTLDGVPFLYNGQEVADQAEHSIYGNRFFGGNLVVDWSRALTAAGRERLEYVRSLVELRRAFPVLTAGRVVWRENDRPEQVVSFSREGEGRKLLTVVNASPEPLTVTVTLEAEGFYPEDLVNNGAVYRFGDGHITVSLLPYGSLLIAS